MKLDYTFKKPDLHKQFDDKDAGEGKWVYQYDIDDAKISVPATVKPIKEVLTELQADGEKTIFWDSSDFNKYVRKDVQDLEFDELPYQSLCLCMIEENDNYAQGKVYEIMRVSMSEEFTFTAEQWIYDEFESKEFADNHGMLEWVQGGNWFSDSISREYPDKYSLENMNKDTNAFYSHIGCIKKNISLGSTKLGIDKLQGSIDRTKPENIRVFGAQVDESVDVIKERTEFIRRAMVLFYAFNWHIYNLEPKTATYSTGKKNKARKKWEEGQYEDFKVHVLMGGYTKTVSTGEGGKHSHNYDVRGHKRTLSNGDVVSVSSHRRGEGEYVNKQYATDKDLANLVVGSGMRDRETVRRKLGTRIHIWIRGLSIALIKLKRIIIK